MARAEEDREFLMQEATALAERIEFLIGYDQIFVGLRANAAVSVFFNADPVYHFNSQGELRRAFVDGKLIKAEGGRLISLRRERTKKEVALVRSTLAADEVARLCAEFELRRQAMLLNLDQGSATIVAQVSANDQLPIRVAEWLAALDYPLRIADSPHVS